MKPHNYREWPVDQIRQWVEVDGKTHQWIGDQLGTSPKQIHKICKREGVTSQRRGPRAGPGHPNWKGGRLRDEDGYWLVWVADHPGVRRRAGRAGSQGYIAEHRLVMERKIGRYLEPQEVVHHLNGKNDDNRPENLELFACNADHLRTELTGRCPNWTEDGKRRIREGHRGPGVPRRGTTRQTEALPGEPPSP